MIPFNVPLVTGTETEYIRQALDSRKLCGDGPFTRQCNAWLENRFGARKALLTTSCSSALDMAALLCGLEPGDEVILPSYTFPSTANAFVLAGARLVFVDIRPDTMNIDEKKIEAAVTGKTRAVCVVHYAGVACEMDAILETARKHGLLVVEDAAQAVMGTYRGQALGTIGDFGCYSFHESKNYSMGEGGAILVNRPESAERAEILREKGTNRTQFYRKQVDKYMWMDYGDSYLPSELNAACLWAQLERAEEINRDRRRSWDTYYKLLQPLTEAGKLELPAVPEGCVHNAHMFYVKLKDPEERSRFMAFLKAKGIGCVFHYVPLHSAPAGRRFGRFSGTDEYTTKESGRLVRLPMYYGLREEDIREVVRAAEGFFGHE